MTSESQDTGSGQRSGLFDSLKRLTATLLRIVSTRLELLATEIEEERAWLGSMLVWTLAALFCAALGIVLASMLVVVYFWDSYRMLALTGLVITFLLGSVLSWRVVLGKVRSKPRLFSTSLAEISKDREKLTQDHHEQ